MGCESIPSVDSYRALRSSYRIVPVQWSRYNRTQCLAVKCVVLLCYVRRASAVRLDHTRTEDQVAKKYLRSRVASPGTLPQNLSLRAFDVGIVTGFRGQYH